MKQVTFIEGANYCENPLTKKGDLFANHLTAKDVLCSVKNESKRHKRKLSTIKLKAHEKSRQERINDH